MMPKLQFPVRLAILVASLAGLAACAAVGPDFQPPQASAPEAYRDAARATGPQSAVTMQAEPDPRWWQSFKDPELDSLIERAVRGNLDLRMAVLRIAQGRAQTQIAGAAGLPSISATASYTRQQLGLKGILQSQGAYDKADAAFDGGGAALDKLTQPIGLFQLGFDASWELDLFGRVRRSVEASDAQTQAAIESRNDALVSLEAEVAQVYAQLRGAQALRRAIADQLTASRDLLDLTQSRQQSGLSSQTDVANQQSQLAQLESRLPSVTQQERQAANSLAVLLGQPPGSLDEELARDGAVPPPPPLVPIGLPATLARRRPDVRQAEAQLHAATAQIGVSVAQLFPDISLSGQFGTRAVDADYLTRWASRFFSVGPSISLPIFEGGRLMADVRLSKAREAELALNYRQTVLDALRDVENSLVAYRSDQQKLMALQRSADAGQSAYDLARDAYRHGIGSFIDVLSAETRLDESRQAVVQTTLQVTTDLVAIYKALGGGWQDTPDAPAPEVGTVGNAGFAGASRHD
jgi:NodT family efflux transporter outer membrane factor (OMF) lipoprotein